MRPRISLCVIARDEEDLLPGCLESARGAVDEIVLVDTGSKDRTTELARAAGAKVIFRPWDDDFAAPRTAAARAASGDWILQLDADERLAPGGAAALIHAAGRGGFLVGLLRLHNAARPDATTQEILSGAARRDRPCLVPRLLRNTGDVEYRGRIHENVVEWMVSHGDGRGFIEADIVHLGYVAQLMTSRLKRERNLALLRRRCEEEGYGVVPAGYLSLELLQVADYAGAQEVVERAWHRVNGAPPSQSILRLALARAALALRHTDLGVVLESLERVERREGPHPDLDFLRGIVHEDLAVKSEPGSPGREEHLRRSMEALSKALERLTGAVWEYVGAMSEVSAHLHLVAVHLLRGEAAEALGQAGLALAQDPTNPSSWVASAEALLAAGEPGRALKAAQRALGDKADGWLVAAAAALALGAREDARIFLGKVRQHRAKGFDHLHRVARLHQLERALGEG
ncbi:MAG TPA: glycosyltransferase [Anaeromyxobacter sp.]|nr:glycosyltransferase [Anaeromyxobacter sp.]